MPVVAGALSAVGPPDPLKPSHELYGEGLLELGRTYLEGVRTAVPKAR